MVQNNFNFIGRIAIKKGDDFKSVTKMSGDTMIMNLPLAIDVKKDESFFVTVTVFNDLARTIGKYAALGGRVAIAGHVSVTKGEKGYFTNFIADSINIIDFAEKPKEENSTPVEF